MGDKNSLKKGCKLYPLAVLVVETNGFHCSQSFYESFFQLQQLSIIYDAGSTKDCYQPMVHIKFCMALLGKVFPYGKVFSFLYTQSVH